MKISDMKKTIISALQELPRGGKSVRELTSSRGGYECADNAVLL
jgi:hypothetical protein